MRPDTIPSAIAQTLFRIPPFPRAQAVAILRLRTEARIVDEAEAAAFATAVRTARVGGCFWSDDDPWLGFEGVEPLTFAPDDPLALLAAIAGCPVRCDGLFASLSSLVPGSADHDAARDALVATYLLAPVDWLDPLSGESVDPTVVIAQMGGWRRLLEANRAIAAAYGFANWKRDTVAALLWDGRRPAPFANASLAHLARLPAGAAVAIWKARVPATFLAALERSGRPILEVEDGFIRSVGLGADCVPPLSIVVDDLGAHYDPSRPSRLEAIIAGDDFDEAMLARAAALRARITAEGISKYGAGGDPLPRPGGERRHVLVTGQVEDDRSVRLGGCGIASNLELLRRARAACPDAYLIYRPHPDVVAGHRKGHVAPSDALALADMIDPGNPIGALIAMVDEVHVITSLAGFEALLHGKTVITHGVPFYAGWGLTTDLGPVPARRGLSRTLDRLIAAVLIAYPRYLDPVSGLPCGPELLVTRIGAGVRREKAALVAVRQGVGWLRRAVQVRQKT